jgi:hypothetical protein
MVKPGFIQ